MLLTNYFLLFILIFYCSEFINCNYRKFDKIIAIILRFCIISTIKSLSLIVLIIYYYFLMTNTNLFVFCAKSLLCMWGMFSKSFFFSSFASVFISLFVLFQMGKALTIPRIRASRQQGWAARCMHLRMAALCRILMIAILRGRPSLLRLSDCVPVIALKISTLIPRWSI